jgi:hypothetical protein
VSSGFVRGQIEIYNGISVISSGLSVTEQIEIGEGVSFI